MPYPHVRVSTMGSMWLFDEIEHVYLRMPKREGPRASPPGKDWGGPDAGELQDLVWLPYESFTVSEEDVGLKINFANGNVETVTGPVLRIRLANDKMIHAPLAVFV